MAACERCGGTGFEIVEKDGREFAAPCACRSSPARQASFFEACRVPPRYEHCTLQSFTPGSDPLLQNLKKAESYCQGYPFIGPDDGLGLLFTGDNGVGKTHLAVAVMRELWEKKGVRGQFWDFHELIREIRHSYNEETRTTELQVLAPVIEAHILLLDDLGAWRMTDWMLDTLFFILNSRYMAKRATLVTTNFPDLPQERKSGDGPMNLRRAESLVERIGPRVRSRLVEMCLVVKMQGDDQRQTRQHSNEIAVRSVRADSTHDR